MSAKTRQGQKNGQGSLLGGDNDQANPRLRACSNPNDLGLDPDVWQGACARSRAVTSRAGMGGRADFPACPKANAIRGRAGKAGRMAACSKDLSRPPTTRIPLGRRPPNGRNRLGRTSQTAPSAFCVVHPENATQCGNTADCHSLVVSS